VNQETAAAPKIVDRSISEAELLLAAQQSWCEALVAIGKAFNNGGHAEAKAAAEKVVDALYAYQYGPVLFKPTLAVSPQTFRTTRAGAVAYLVGGDSDYPDDSGFALMGWKDWKVENAALYIAGDTANTMGKVHFTSTDGDVTTVDKTWGFMKDDQGALRIFLHHSSLVYGG